MSKRKALKVGQWRSEPQDTVELPINGSHDRAVLRIEVSVDTRWLMKGDFYRMHLPVGTHVLSAELVRVVDNAEDES